MFRKLAVVVAALATLSLAGCGYNHAAVAGRRDQGRVVRSAEPVPAPRRPGAEPRQHGQGLRRAGREGADGGHARARQRRRHQGDAGAHQRPGRVPEIPAGAGPAVERAVAPAGRRRELSEPQVRRAVPRPAIAARRHGEPHHRRAQPLHQDRAGVQHDGAPVPDQPDGDGVRSQREAELHRGRRSCGIEAADGRLRQGRAGRAGRDAGASADDAGRAAAAAGEEGGRARRGRTTC